MANTHTHNGLDSSQELLIKLVESNPDDWAMRKKVVRLLFDAGYSLEASKLLWNAPEIPPVDEEIAFAACVVSKGQPSRAMRLLNTVIERNEGHPESNLAMAKTLLCNGLVLQAIRFYGAATAESSELADEEFELRLIQADSEEENWNEVVKQESFPWDPPREPEAIEEVDIESLKPKREVLLSSVTQPVPLKAPVTPQPVNHQNNGENVPVLSPDRLVAPDMAEPPAAGSRPAPVANPFVNRAEENNVVTPPSQEAPQARPPEAPAAGGTFFKSSDEVQQLGANAPAAPSAQVPLPPAAQPPAPPVVNGDAGHEAFADLPPVLEDQEDKPKPMSAFKRLFNSGKKSKKEEEEHVAPEMVNGESPVPPEAPPQPATQAPQPPQQVFSAGQSNGSHQAHGAGQPNGTNGANGEKPHVLPVPMIFQAPEGEKYQPPKELTDHTQLVTLAPRNGSAFFDELAQKYQSLPEGKSAAPATIAREKASVDNYVELINKACNKDLDSFSKLLGLHRVMTEANCNEWVEDMDLLRKGYGDAVLATVVSKYSVAECREILGAVYRKPASAVDTAGAVPPPPPGAPGAAPPAAPPSAAQQPTAPAAPAPPAVTPPAATVPMAMAPQAPMQAPPAQGGSNIVPIR